MQGKRTGYSEGIKRHSNNLLANSKGSQFINPTKTLPTLLSRFFLNNKYFLKCFGLTFADQDRYMQKFHNTRLHYSTPMRLINGTSNKCTIWYLDLFTNFWNLDKLGDMTDIDHYLNNTLPEGIRPATDDKDTE